LSNRPRLFVASYFGHLANAVPALLATPIEAIGPDLVAGPANLDRLASAGVAAKGKTIVAGPVDGHNIRRTDLRHAAAVGATLRGLADHLAVSASCSLLHVPVDLAAETGLDPALTGTARLRPPVGRRGRRPGHRAARRRRRPARPPPTAPAAWRDVALRARPDALRPTDRQRAPYPQRAAAQQARLRLSALKRRLEVRGAR